MDNREKKIKFVQKNIQACEASSCKAYPYGSIPAKLIKNACTSYADRIFGQEKVIPEDVIGLIDASIRGNGKIGVLLTETGVFYKEAFEKPGYVSYEQIKRTKCVPNGVIVNCDQEKMKELVGGLTAIHTKQSIGERINGLAEAVNDKRESTERIIDTIEEVGEGISNLLDKFIRRMD